MNKFRRKAKRSLLGALSLLSAFSSVSPMSAMNRGGSVVVEDEDDDLSGYDTEAEEEDVPELKKPGLSTAAKVGIGVGVGGAAALGIGLLASYLSKSDGEIGKKITIKDIDLENRYHNGKIDGFNVGEKTGYDFMKRYFPNSGIKDGFCYEYLGGKEFKIVDVYLNEEDSFEYLGADIKNSPTLKNMNESNGDAIDKKTRYRVTRNTNGYSIVKSTLQAPNPVPVRTPALVPPGQPVAPVNNLPTLHTFEDARMLVANSLIAYDTAEMVGADNVDDGVFFLYELDNINRKVKRSTLNVNVFAESGARKGGAYPLRRVSGKVLLNTMERSPGNCKLYGQGHPINPDFRYDVMLRYDQATKGIQIRPLLTTGTLLSASQASSLGLLNEAAQPNAFLIVDDNGVIRVFDGVAVVGNDLFERNKRQRGLNPGIVYVLRNENLEAYEINKEYLRSNSGNRFTIGDLVDCQSLKSALVPGTSSNFEDLFANMYYSVNHHNVEFRQLDCVVTDLDNPRVRLASSAPLETFTDLDDNSLSKFGIYENPDSTTPLTIQELRSVQGRRVYQDQRTGKLCLTRFNTDLSREENRVLHPAPAAPVRIPNNVYDTVKIPDNQRLLGDDIRNFNHDGGGDAYSLSSYLNHLIDNPSSPSCPLHVVGANNLSPGREDAAAFNLHGVREIFARLIPGLQQRRRYVRKSCTVDDNDGSIYNVYEIVGISNDGQDIPRYGWVRLRVGDRDRWRDGMISDEPRIAVDPRGLDLQNIPLNMWIIVPHY